MISIDQINYFRFELRTRMPFRYGIATMTATPHAFLKIHASFNGLSGRGMAADSLIPKWFTKDPEKSAEQDIEEMLRVIRHASEAARKIEAETVFDFWWQLYAAQDAWRKEADFPPLLAHFGTSLIERGLIEAWCRAHDTPFYQALRSNALGIDLGRLHPEIAGTVPADYLGEPLREVGLRHTVGLPIPCATPTSRQMIN